MTSVVLLGCGGSSTNNDAQFLDAYLAVVGEVQPVADLRSRMNPPPSPDQETAHALVIATAVNGYTLPSTSGTFAACRKLAEPALATLERELVPLMGKVLGEAADPALIAAWTERREVSLAAMCDLANSWKLCGEAATKAKLTRPALDEPFPCPR